MTVPASIDGSNRPKRCSFEWYVERFWARVDKRGPDECWPWKATKLPQGYGIVAFKPSKLNYPVGTHRLAYWLTHGGEFPKDPVCVLHSCDNPPCCNPAHLRLGDRVENYADMRTRGRKIDKFTADDIREIRSKATGKNDRELAAEFNTVPRYIWGIRTRRVWKGA